MIKTYQVDFRSGGQKPKHKTVEPNPVVVIRTARQLALAHHIQRLVDEGKLRDYAHAARTLGLTRARISQIVDLLFLSPSLQAPILRGELNVSERQLRLVLRHFDWRDQETALGVGRDSVGLYGR